MKKKILLLLLLFAIVKVEAQTSTFTVVDSLFAKGRYKLALKELDKNNPSFLSNYKKAIIYESIDDYKKTAEFLEKALIFKNDDKANLRLAKTYQRLKKYKSAVSIYEEIVARDSLNLILKYRLGKLYLITRSGDGAISTFNNLIEKDDTNANYSYQLALAYALKNNKDQMMNSFLDAYVKDTNHLKAIVRLALNYRKLNDSDSTDLFVNKGLALDNNHINLNKIKINNMYLDKNYGEAVPLLLHLDTIDRRDTYSKSMLAKVYYNMDSLEKAKLYFKKLTIIDKKDFKPHTYLGHIAMKEKDYNAAMMSYMMATFIGKEKRDEEYFGLATMYYETKKPKAAINAFQKAVRENGSNHKALFQLAKLSDDYYKDKKIGYELYIKYIERFYNSDEGMSNFVKGRIKEIKKEHFLRGETLK